MGSNPAVFIFLLPPQAGFETKRAPSAGEEEAAGRGRKRAQAVRTETTGSRRGEENPAVFIVDLQRDA